jgi:hypothetical protein
MASMPSCHRIVHLEVKEHGAGNCWAQPAGGLGDVVYGVLAMGLVSLGLAVSCWYVMMSCGFFILSLNLMPKVA